MSYPWYGYTVWCADNTVMHMQATGIDVTDGMVELLRDISAGKWRKENGERLAPVVRIMYIESMTADYDPIPGYVPGGPRHVIEPVRNVDEDSVLST